MYIPSADMGEYDDYQQSLTDKRPQGGGRQFGSLDRQASRGQMGLERQQSRGKLGNQSRLPSGYFVLDGNIEGKQVAREPAQGQLNRQSSFNSICSLHDSSQDGQSGTGVLPRQTSRAKLTKQQSKGQLRRQHSTSRVVRERDTYDQGKTGWQDSLRGSSKKDIKAGESGDQKLSPSHNEYSETGNRKLLDPGLRRRSRSKSATGRSKPVSPAPGGLLASTHSSRAKTTELSNTSATLPRRSSRSARSPMRPQTNLEKPLYPLKCPDGPDLPHSRRSPSISRCSVGVRVEEEPYTAYRSFEEFRDNREKLGSRQHSYKKSFSPHRKNSTPARKSSSPSRSSNSTSRHGSYSGYEQQAYFPRKTSNSSSSSGFGSYSGNGSSGYAERRSPSLSQTGSTSSTPNYGSRNNYREIPITIDQNKYKSEGQNTHKSPGKISLGALKIATVQPWEETKTASKSWDNESSYMEQGNNNNYQQRMDSFATSNRKSGTTTYIGQS